MTAGLSRLNGLAPFSRSDAMEDNNVPVGGTQDTEPEVTVATDEVRLAQGSASVVRADVVHLKQGGAQTVFAREMDVRQGGVVQADCDEMSVEEGGIVLARAGTLSVERGGVVLAAADKALLTNASAGVLITRNAELTNSRTTLLLASQVSGTVDTLLDTRGAALAGLAAGLGVGIVLLAGSLLKRR
jgi:hypothetical protein